MADSEVPKQETAPSESTAVVKIDSLGRVSKFIKGKDGKFQKQPRKHVDAALAGRQFLDFLKSKEVGSDGKIDKKTKTWLHRIIQRQAQIAVNEDPDPKAMSAATKAAEFLTQYGIGKPRMNPDDSEALRKAGVSIVIVPAPELMHPEPVEENSRKKPTVPEFVDAEVVSTNDPPTQK